MRLTKEEFCTAVNRYEELCKQESKLIETLGVSCEWKPSEWLNAYYDLLTQICDLPENKYYGTDLDYYCYELNFGHEWKSGVITDKNGNDIPCGNAEELWNMIVVEG